MRYAIRTLRPFSTLAVYLATCALLTSLAVSAVPGVINYQGHLTDNTPQQNPVNATLSMDFSIWDGPVGGVSLWTETQSVQVVNGLFNVLLGQSTPIGPTVFDGTGDRYLEIHVASETLAPRQRIGATPYASVAASASDASSLGGTPAASYQLRIANPCPPGQAISSVAADGSVSCVAVGSAGCINGDCRTSWNNQDASSVSPLPRTCPVNTVPVSTGPYSWACQYVCQSGKADCNNNLGDGCETSVATDVNNCGGCGLRCSGNHVPTPSCSGSCNGACAPGFVDCNANELIDGCEINVLTDPNNCGNCGTVCSSNNVVTRTCGSGVCNGACSPGFVDCNGNKQTDGCETQINSDVNNCGACGNVCTSPYATCQNGACTIQFSDAFVQFASSPAQCAGWQAFATHLDAGTTYSSVNIKGTNDPAGVTCTGVTANQVCQALRTGTPFGPVSCNGRDWLVGVGCGTPGAVELTGGNPGNTSCLCYTGSYTVRPCHGGDSWGGVNTQTCSAASQTMTVSCKSAN